jgi:nitroreductase/NAD-dependent dihydropyrimidine dehydrogenase PreA subunit
MLTIKGVIQEKCTICGECVADCPPMLYSRAKDADGKDLIIFSDPYKGCIKCGHCIAVCPVDAIAFTARQKPDTFKYINNPEKILSYTSMLHAIQARRSIRRYKKRPVSDQDIKQILEAMHYAPTASNKQQIKYTVIKNPLIIKDLTEKTFKVIRLFISAYKVLSMIKFLLAGNLKSLIKKNNYYGAKKIIEKYKAGYDPILFHTPCVIILSSPAYGHLAGTDAGIALTHGMLAAQTLGLGTCLIGFVQELLLLKRKLSRKLGITRGYKVRGVMTLGYPDVKYHRIPIRKLPDI